MGKPTTSTMLRVIGVLNIIIGAFVAFWMLTVGLLITLFTSDTNKTSSAFVSFFPALVFAVLYLKGGIGILRSCARSRIYLNITWGISLIFMVFYILGELKNGFSSNGIGSDFFDIWSWLGGIIFWSVMTSLGILHISFLNSGKVKELLVR